jgi:hypothetical protein
LNVSYAARQVIPPHFFAMCNKTVQSFRVLDITYCTALLSFYTYKVIVARPGGKYARNTDSIGFTPSKIVLA